MGSPAKIFTKIFRGREATGYFSISPRIFLDRIYRTNMVNIKKAPLELICGELWVAPRGVALRETPYPKDKNPYYGY
jgi:hypothetical protein